ncbi:hypothetical protein Tamer19_42740 [Cupriavidus sp. TA19]|uniref:hypothetical protein n=1 Tax=unclassified Cupriavidus TaxID=2640874 RepID=UPI000E2E4879|nr:MULTISPECIES: hypothetical protein [unclassified Cupriavidus]BDB30500.1 hypothetical protein CTP10_R79170 [Cupriavidus sp. P-10]GLC94866.1 hypothetical protein Tamer19_42740 [Cupriavidus sp. TA19]
MTTRQSELWIVSVVDLSGVPKSVVSPSRDEATSQFLHLAYLFVHATPDQRLRVVGDDEDAALTGMHLIWDSDDGGAVCLVSLTRAAVVRSAPGWSAAYRQNQTFASIAAEAQAALDATAGHLDPREVDRLSRSSAVFALNRPLAPLLVAGDERDVPPIELARARSVWEEMKAVDQYIEMKAVVR